MPKRKAPEYEIPFTYCLGVDPAADDYIEDANSVKDDNEFERRFVLPPNVYGLTYTLSTYYDHQQFDMNPRSARALTATEFKACFDMIQRNSSCDYMRISIGWDEKRTKKDMKLHGIRYLLGGNTALQAERDQKPS